MLIALTRWMQPRSTSAHSPRSRMRGNQIEGDQPLGRATLGIDREGDAEPAKQLLGRRLLDDEGFDGQVVEETGKGRVGGPDLARLVAHLVKKLAGRRFGCFGPGADARPSQTLCNIAPP